MKILDKLERLIRPIAIPNLTVLLIALQVFTYVMNMVQPGTVNGAYLVWSQVLQGEVWRLLTFLLIPPFSHPILMFFSWYIFYMMGTALETNWGTARYNLYLLIGIVLTIAASIGAPNYPIENAFLAGTVFLAFARYNPDFELLVFFILPVKLKWLALLAWIHYGFQFLVGSSSVRLIVVASVGNFLLFFGPEIVRQLRGKRLQAARRADAIASANRPRHTCVTCGITNLTHPDMDFRYCSTCAGQCGYCTEHIRDHVHVT